MLEDHDLGGLDDIDLDNEAAKNAIYDSIKDWFTYTGADAARVDAAKCMKPSDIHELQEYLGVATFGENFDMDVSFVNRNTGKLNANQLDFLNRLYTQYNRVRHPYSHWSASDVDTAVITDCATAREIILEGLELLDEYYTLF